MESFHVTGYTERRTISGSEQKIFQFWKSIFISFLFLIKQFR